MRLFAMILPVAVLAAALAAPAWAQQAAPEWKPDCICAVTGTPKFMGVVNVSRTNLDEVKKLLAAGSGELGSTVRLVGKKCEKPAMCGKSYTDPRRQLDNAAVDGPRTIKVISNAGLPREGNAIKADKLAAGMQIVLVGDPVP